MALKDADTDRLVLPATLDVTTLGPLLDELRGRRGAPLVVYGSAVTRAGCQGVQLLISTRRTWREDDLALRFVDPSPCLEDAFALAGATAVLQP